jgi:hypothetical protein
MQVRTAIVIGLTGVALAAGCGNTGAAILGAITGTNETTVRLVNATNFDLAVELYYSNDQLHLEPVIKEFGTEVLRDIPANSETSFSVACDELQALVIDDADLNIAAGFGPGTDTRVYRDGTDFDCGDTLVFTFDSDSLLDLTVDFRID